jgi:hypothetical protein
MTEAVQAQSATYKIAAARGWGNQPGGNPNVETFVENVIKSQSIDELVFAFNVEQDSTQDSDGSELTGTTVTPYKIQKKFQEMAALGFAVPKLTLIPVSRGHNGRFWSKPLNVIGEYALHKGEYAHRAQEAGARKATHIFCVSNEVDFKGAEGIEALMEAASNEKASCGFMQFDCVKGPEEFVGKPLEAISYLVTRNTATMWNADQLELYYDTTARLSPNGKGHFFDEETDKYHGMEDNLTAMRLYAQGYAFGPEACRVPVAAIVRAGLILPQDKEAFDKKLAGEANSMKFIYGTYFTPEIVKAFFAETYAVSPGFKPDDFMKKVDDVLTSMEPVSYRPGMLRRSAQILAFGDQAA